MGAALAMHPAGFFEVEIDVEPAGFKLGGVDLGLVLRLPGLALSSDLLTQALQLLLGSFAGFRGFAQLTIPFGELMGKFLQLFTCGAGRCGRLRQHGQQRLIETGGPSGVAIPAVGEGKPAQHMKQLTGDEHRGRHAHRLSAVHRLIAAVLDELDATQRLFANEMAKVKGMDQLREAWFSPGSLQLGIVLIHPLHQQLDGAAGVEAGGAGIGEGTLFHPHGLGMQLRPLAGDQGVLGGHWLDLPPERLSASIASVT